MLVLVAFAPSVLLLALFLAADRYEPEPRGHIAAAVGLGVVAWLIAVGAARLVGGVAPFFEDAEGTAARAFEAFVMAGLVEELARWSLLAGVIYRWQELDEPLDGIIYGVALALGFGTVENGLIVISGENLRVGLLRALFSVPAHSLFGATMGAFIGAARHQASGGAQRARWLALALLVPTVVHGLYDFLLLALVGPAMYAVVALGSLGLWGYVLRRVRQLRERSPFRTG